VRRLEGSRVLLAISCAALGIGCAQPGGTVGGAAGAGPTAGSGGAGAAGGGGAGGAAGPTRVVPLGRERCRAPAGVSASPGTIEEAVQLLNALPKPTSVACFIESLARPLSAYATDSIFSAQPAFSYDSPRVFLKVNQLWISVVVEGKSSFLLEFGFQPIATELRTIKAELELPLAAPITPSVAYERVRFGTGTSCGLCHYDERPVDGVEAAGAFASVAFRPHEQTYVSIESLRRANLACDFQANFPRCELLSALFDGGPVVETPFPSEMATFF
jgi:hypothetical protein